MLLLKRSEAGREDERAVSGRRESKMGRRESPQVGLPKICHWFLKVFFWFVMRNQKDNDK